MFMIEPQIVASSLRRLRQRRIHRTFIAYLCVQWTAAATGRTSTLRVDFKEFFNTFLTVAGGPHPYVVPFVEQPTVHNEWQNSNLAGSYAPSSLREASPLPRVVEVIGTGRDTRYSLRDDHAQLALTHLTFGNKIPGVDLAILLYRDYGLNSPYGNPKDWLTVFQEEFGYLTGNGSVTRNFELLYESDWSRG